MVVWVSLIGIGCFIGLFARAKGHSFLLWWLYGAALPLIALPHSFFIPDFNGDEPWSLRRFGLPIRRRSCDQCGARVSDDDVICGNCNHRLIGEPTEVEAPNELEKPDEAMTALLDSAFSRLAEGTLKPGRTKTVVRGGTRPTNEQPPAAAKVPDGSQAVPADRRSSIEKEIKPATGAAEPIAAAQPVRFTAAEEKERIVTKPAERARPSEPPAAAIPAAVSAEVALRESVGATSPDPVPSPNPAAPSVSAGPASAAAAAKPSDEPGDGRKQAAPAAASPAQKARQLETASPPPATAPTVASAPATGPAVKTRGADIGEPARPPVAARSDEPSKAAPQVQEVPGKDLSRDEATPPPADPAPSVLATLWRKLTARTEEKAETTPLGAVAAAGDPVSAEGVRPASGEAPAKSEKPEKTVAKPELAAAAARVTIPEKPIAQKANVPMTASEPAPSPVIKAEPGAKPEPAAAKRPVPDVAPQAPAVSAVPLRAAPAAQRTSSPTARRTEPKLSRGAPRASRPPLAADPRMAPSLKSSPDVRPVPSAPLSSAPRPFKMSKRSSRIALGALAAALIVAVAAQSMPRSAQSLSASVSNAWDEIAAAIPRTTRPLVEFATNTWNEIILGTRDPIVRQGPTSTAVRRPSAAPAANAPGPDRPTPPSAPSVAPTPALPSVPTFTPIPTPPRGSSVAAVTPKEPAAGDRKAASEGATPLLAPSSTDGSDAAAFEAMRPTARIAAPVSSEELMAMVEKALQGDVGGVAPISASGEVVAMVQQKLRERGYDPGVIDGRAGPRTRTAIRAYRQSIGLKPEGDLDLSLMENLGIVGKQLTPFVSQ